MAAKKKENKKTTPAPKGAKTKGNVPNYGKQIKDLQGTITKQGESMEQMQEYVTGSSVIINTIANDPALRESFQKAMAKQQGNKVQNQQSQQIPGKANQNPPVNQANPGLTQEVNEMKTERRDDIINQFEKEYGISESKEEEQTEVKKKMANFLAGFGTRVDEMPVTLLKDSLEKAYVGTVGVDKLREEGKLDGIAQMRQNQMGVAGTTGGAAPKTEDQENKLTDAQVAFAEKLKVDPKKATKTYQKQDEEKDREKVIKKAK